MDSVPGGWGNYMGPLGSLGLMGPVSPSGPSGPTAHRWGRIPVLRPTPRQRVAPVSDAAVVDRLLDTVQDPLCPPNYPSSGRLGPMARNQVVALVGGPSSRRLARA